MGIMTRSIKRKLIKAKIALHQTIQKILDINRRRKSISFSTNPAQKQKVLNEELRVLNRVAEYQARLVKHYEHTLATRD